LASKIVCPICGGELKPNDVACATCGAKFPEGAEEDILYEEAINRFMNINGIGEKKARALYAAGYKSLEALKSASEDDDLGIKGFGDKITQSIIDHFEEEKHGLFLCSSCGGFMSEDSNTCPRCGAVMEDADDEEYEELETAPEPEGESSKGLYLCPFCGAFVSEEAQNCPQCGSALEESDEEDEDIGEDLKDLSPEELEAMEVERPVFEDEPEPEEEELVLDEEVDTSDQGAVMEKFLATSVQTAKDVPEEKPPDTLEMEAEDVLDYEKKDISSAILGAMKGEEVEIPEDMFDEELLGPEPTQEPGPIPDPEAPEPMPDPEAPEPEPMPDLDVPEPEPDLEAPEPEPDLETPEPELDLETPEPEPIEAEPLALTEQDAMEEALPSLPQQTASHHEESLVDSDIETGLQGEEIETPMLYLCKVCGAFIREGASRCEFCGADLDVDTRVTVEAEEPLPAPSIGTSVTKLKSLLKVRGDPEPLPHDDEMEEIIFCPHCGAFITEEASTCPICSNEITEHLPDYTLPLDDDDELYTGLNLCQNCGAFVSGKGDICEVCGESLTKDTMMSSEDIPRADVSEILEENAEDVLKATSVFSRMFGSYEDKAEAQPATPKRSGELLLCPSCGAFVSDTAMSCTICGARLVEGLDLTEDTDAYDFLEDVEKEIQAVEQKKEKITAPPVVDMDLSRPDEPPQTRKSEEAPLPSKDTSFEADGRPVPAPDGEDHPVDAHHELTLEEQMELESDSMTLDALTLQEPDFSEEEVSQEAEDSFRSEIDALFTEELEDEIDTSHAVLPGFEILEEEPRPAAPKPVQSARPRRETREVEEPEPVKTARPRRDAREAAEPVKAPSPRRDTREAAQPVKAPRPRRETREIAEPEHVKAARPQREGVEAPEPKKQTSKATLEAQEALKQIKKQRMAAVRASKAATKRRPARAPEPAKAAPSPRQRPAPAARAKPTGEVYVKPKSRHAEEPAKAPVHTGISTVEAKPAVSGKSQVTVKGTKSVGELRVEPLTSRRRAPRTTQEDRAPKWILSKNMMTPGQLWDNYRKLLVFVSNAFLAIAVLEYFLLASQWDSYYNMYYLGLFIAAGIIVLVGVTLLSFAEKRTWKAMKAIKHKFEFYLGLFILFIPLLYWHGGLSDPLLLYMDIPILIVGLLMMVHTGYVDGIKAVHFLQWLAGAGLFLIFVTERVAEFQPEHYFIFYPAIAGSSLMIMNLVFLYTEKRVAVTSRTTLKEGDRAFSHQDYPKAMKYYEKAIINAPEDDFNDIAWASKGATLIKLGKYDEALKAMNHALKINPYNEVAWNGKGNVMVRMNKLKDAVKCYNRALAINPKYEVAWNNKGNLYARLGNYNKALTSYDKALGLVPKYKDAWINKGYVLVKMGKYDEAVKCADKILKQGGTAVPA